eukprot:Mycagemm_TRINITY_DN10289_c2_g4::TRINITY_DN10289_c2_g4_i1::g.3597::m.3597 type:complete len:148 gc:universal TRINITY_DN10289_c2_g4_i1:127-570(+)
MCSHSAQARPTTIWRRILPYWRSTRSTPLAGHGLTAPTFSCSPCAPCPRLTMWPSALRSHPMHLKRLRPCRRSLRYSRQARWQRCGVRWAHRASGRAHMLTLRATFGASLCPSYRARIRASGRARWPRRCTCQQRSWPSSPVRASGT